MEKIRFGDPGWTKAGSGINMPDPQHCNFRWWSDQKPEKVSFIDTFKRDVKFRVDARGLPLKSFILLQYIDIFWETRTNLVFLRTLNRSGTVLSLKREDPDPVPEMQCCGSGFIEYGSGPGL
jgi:hypothetical protein